MVGNDLANRKDRGSQLAKDYLVQRRLSYLDNLVGNTSYVAKNIVGKGISVIS